MAEEVGRVLQRTSRRNVRISGPLLDRIDIITEVPSLHFDELRSTTVPESSAVVKQRVETARAIQRERFKGTSCRCNANMQAPRRRAATRGAFRRGTRTSSSAPSARSWV